MSVCDVCNASTSFATGTTFTADEFRRKVARGFRPSRSDLHSYIAMLGLSEQQAYESWKNTLVATNNTDWLLCPACAARANQY
jgi:hypothetical protein